MDPNANPLLSSRPSDSGLTVSLHPLVLLTASDQITRHRVRNQRTPVVGILLGQQKGREITAEHAFAAALKRNQNAQWSFDNEWLDTRIQQYKDVHKAPALDVVGWFCLCPESGPLLEFVQHQKQITAIYNESAILLALHPESFGTTEANNGKLPISTYESVLEIDLAKDESTMQVDGEEPPTASDLKFRPIPYTIETDETEMIAINYVAKGAGSAAAVAESPSEAKPTATSVEIPPPEDKKGKGRADVSPSASQAPSTSQNKPISTLMPEEEDQIANLTTRLNSIKMLQSRLTLLGRYLNTIPPSYISDQSQPLTPTSPDPATLPHLRTIQALLTRLSLLTPSDPATTTATLQNAAIQQSNDVHLSALLALLGQNTQALSELGRKFNTVESTRNSKKSRSGGLGGAGGGIGGAGGAGSTMGLSDEFDATRISNIGGWNDPRIPG